MRLNYFGVIFSISLAHGMMMMMEYGDHQKYQIQLTRDHGNARFIVSVEISDFVSCRCYKLCFSSMILGSQKIKNPNYKGKWKTPWIDNPGKISNISNYCLIRSPMRKYINFGVVACFVFLIF